MVTLREEVRTNRGNNGTRKTSQVTCKDEEALRERLRKLELRELKETSKGPATRERRSITS